MLAYILALVVGLSSFALYMAAFFFPEVHRKNDFIWSGVGLFYALVLWVCAGRITGGVLLGQTVSVALLGWLGWETLTLRRQIAPRDLQTVTPSVGELQATVLQGLSHLSKPETIAQFSKPLAKQYAKLRAWLEALISTSTKPTQPTQPTPPAVEPDPPYVPLTPADFADAGRRAKPTTDVSAPQVKSVTAIARKPPAENHSRETIAKQVQDVFKGLTQKRESKPVYVRKQFRTPEAEPMPTTEDKSDKASDSQPLVPPLEPPSAASVSATVIDIVEQEELAPPPAATDADSPDADLTDADSKAETSQSQ